jgi:hypothetical protein
MKKRRLFVVLAIAAVLVLSSCVPGPNPSVNVLDTAGNIAGFWSGLWHGVISPVTFIISLFSHNVNVYDVYNNGNWYNFGFILGVCIIFGGGGHGAKHEWKKNKKKETPS